VLSRNSLITVLKCAKRMSTNKATYLSLKSDFVKGVWAESWSFPCLVILERERSKFQRVLRDFAVWRSVETRAWRGSCSEIMRRVCEWLWDPRGEGDILITCIFAIFHLVLLFVVKEASWLWKAKILCWIFPVGTWCKYFSIYSMMFYVLSVLSAFHSSMPLPWSRRCMLY